MRSFLFLTGLAAPQILARAANIVLSNDDGWAEINIRTLFKLLTAAGENVVLSAPAENESGTGMASFSPLFNTSNLISFILNFRPMFPVELPYSY